MSSELATIERKVCAQCEKNLKLDRYATHTSAACKTCETQSAKLIKQEKIRISKRVNESLLANLNRMADEMEIQVVTEPPPLSEYARALTEAYGGVQGFALLHAAEFLMSKPGSPTRQRLLGDVGKHISKNSELGGGKWALDAMSDDELEDYIEQRSRKVLTVAEED